MSAEAEATLAKGLAEDPSARCRTADEWREQMLPIADLPDRTQIGSSALPFGAAPTAEPSSSRGFPLPVVLGASAAIVVLMGIAALVLRGVSGSEAIEGPTSAVIGQPPMKTAVVPSRPTALMCRANELITLPHPDLDEFAASGGSRSRAVEWFAAADNADRGAFLDDLLTRSSSSRDCLELLLQLVREYRLVLPPIRRYLIADDDVDAAEQQTLVAIAFRSASYTGAGSARSWMNQVAANEAKMLIRSRERHQSRAEGTAKTWVARGCRALADLLMAQHDLLKPREGP